MSKCTHPIRIVTCCYCDARSTLSVTPGQRLLCHGCGAPVSRITPLQAQMGKRKGTAGKRKPAIPHPAERGQEHLAKDRPVRRKKGKRRSRSFWYHVTEAFDDLDDLFDIFD